MYGRYSDMMELVDFCQRNEVTLVEDCAQSFGSKIDDRHLGTFGQYAAFSFYPTKNLGGIGDGGLIICPESELNNFARMRFYGFQYKNFAKEIGLNSRLDTVNAKFLSLKLDKFEFIQDLKASIANVYYAELPKEILLPPPANGTTHSNHIFPIYVKSRNRIRRALRRKEIETMVHYPIPVYRQPALARYIPPYRSKVTDKLHLEELSLPISALLSEIDAKCIANIISNSL
jgi:dTDP-4-amino-4,6-dideoxygalactose transaminase